MTTLNPSSAGRDVASQVGGGFPNGGLEMCEHRQASKAVRTVDGEKMREQEPVRPGWKWVVVGDGDDDDFSAWPDESGDDVSDFAAGLAAMRQAERDWWASAFDA